jgi:hypothetical protein
MGTFLSFSLPLTLTLTRSLKMTERTGGSDVSNSETIAIRDPSGGANDFLLTGYKFFTSATTGQFALGLARIQDSTGKADVCSLSHLLPYIILLSFFFLSFFFNLRLDSLLTPPFFHRNSVSSAFPFVMIKVT